MSTLTITRDERKVIWKYAAWCSETPADRLHGALDRLYPAPINEHTSVVPDREDIAKWMGELADRVAFLDVLGWEWQPEKGDGLTPGPEQPATLEIPTAFVSTLRDFHARARAELRDHTPPLIDRMVAEGRIAPGDFQPFGREGREVVDELLEVTYVIRQILERHNYGVHGDEAPSSA